MPEIKDSYKYQSTDVAFYLIAKANEEKLGINVTKAQKLLYIVYGAYLRVYGERLLNEHPKAWPYGPVFPTTRKAILKRITTEELEFPISEVNAELKTDEKLNKAIDFALRIFGDWNAGQLTSWSHQEGTPWSQTVQSSGFKWGAVIPDELIYEYFLKLVKVNDGQ